MNLYRALGFDIKGDRNTYVVQVYGPYAASALAAATMTRSMFAVAFPLFMRQAAHGIGVQYIGTLFGCVAACLSPIPFGKPSPVFFLS